MRMCLSQFVTITWYPLLRKFKCGTFDTIRYDKQANKQANIQTNNNIQTYKYKNTNIKTYKRYSENT